MSKYIFFHVLHLYQTLKGHQLCCYCETIFYKLPSPELLFSLLSLSFQFYVSPSLASFVLLIVPPMAGLAVIYGRYLRSISKRTQDALAQATQVRKQTDTASGLNSLNLYYQDYCYDPVFWFLRVVTQCFWPFQKRSHVSPTNKVFNSSQNKYY